MPTDPPPRGPRMPWGVIIMLFCLGLLVAFVSFSYLLPALDAFYHADAKGKSHIVAVSRLLLAVVLFVIACAMLLVARIGRFFHYRPTGPPSKTTIIDAWAESGRRLKPPPPPDDENEKL